MKSYLVLFLFVSFSASAQIEIKKSPAKTVIGEFKNGGSIGAQLSRMESDVDTTNLLLYSNLKYRTITDYQTIVFDGDPESLYEILKTFFKEENVKNKDYKVNLRLGDKDVILSSTRTMGITSIIFWTDNGFFYITEKQLKKLFGKD